MKPLDNADFLRNPTAGYSQSIFGLGAATAWIMNNEPWFTWGDVILMMRDPAVRYGMRLLRSPYSRVTWTVKANKDAVAQFVHRTMLRFWKFDLPKLMTSYHKWGRMVGGAEYSYNSLHKVMDLCRIRRIEPYDAEAHVYSSGPEIGQFAGYVLRNAYGSLSSNAFVSAPNSFYYAGHEELAQLCDMPKIAGAFTPYLEKNAPGGLRASRRLFYWTKAIGKTIIRYPDIEIKLRDGTKIHAEDLARQLGERLQNGSVVCIPNGENPNFKGKAAWEIDEPAAQNDNGSVKDSVKDADSEIWIGLDIPPEIVRASEVGSGWSGRGIPMETWYAGADETAGMVFSAFKDQILTPLVELNYNTRDWEVELDSLLEAFRKQADNQQPGGGGGGAGGPTGASPQGGGGAPGAPYQGPRGGRGFYTANGHVRYSHDQDGGKGGASLSASGVNDDNTREKLDTAAEQLTGVTRKTAKLRKIALLAMLELRERAIMAGNPHKYDDDLHTIAELLDDPEELAKAFGNGGINLSWVEYGVSRSGKTRWREDTTGKLRYQKTMPGTWTAERQRRAASFEKAKALYSKAFYHQATADDLRELATHVPSLTVPQLRSMRQQLQASFGGKNGKKRDQMVQALISHVLGRSESVEREAGGAVEHAPSNPPRHVTVGEGDAAHVQLHDLDPSLVDHKPNDPSTETAHERSRAMVQTLEDGGELPPIKVKAKENGRYELTDGNARVFAHRAHGSTMKAILIGPDGNKVKPGIDTNAQVGTIPSEAQTLTVNDGQSQTGSGEGDQGGLRRGESVGEPAPQEPGAESAGVGGGVGGGLPVLPGDESQRRGEQVPDDDGAGDGPASRKRTRPQRASRVGGPPRNEDGQLLGGGIDGSEPALPNPTPAEESLTEAPTPENPTDLSAGNYRYDSRDFFRGGLKAKFNANLAALRTLREIQAEGRTHATPEEQAILAKFTGWGQFPAVFNEFWDGEYSKKLREDGVDHATWNDERDKWSAEREALQALMTDDEWQSAKRSTLNAHYTHPDIVDAHWKMAQKLGFKGGRFLETSAGIGYYLGMMPADVAASTRTTAVELDPATGSMLNLLYPAANVEQQGFEKHLTPDGYYDLIASNVPFGDYRVNDKRYNAHRALIHDYFFLKSADKVKPGGLVMHITSKGTMDKADSKIREELAKTCDLVSAIRFPGAAHKENAGTDVVTDMLILRKRKPGEAPNGIDWMKTTTVPDPAGGEPIPVNEYFHKHPEQVLGTIDRTGSMYRGDSVNVSRTPDYEQKLQAAIDRLPANVLDTSRAPAERFAPEALPAPGDVKDGGYHVDGDKVFIRDGDEMREQKIDAKKAQRIAAHLEVRDALRNLLKLETAGEDGTAARAELNSVYDAFVKKWGPLNGKANKQAFMTDPDSPPVLALEHYDAESKTAKKADIFNRTTVSAVKPVEHVQTAGEGVGVSLHTHGKLDLSYIAGLMRQPEHVVAKQLVDQGVAFNDPTEGWKPASQYLSGNVRRKLAMARAAAANDPAFTPNVAALEKVQPEDIPHDEIEVRLGSPWVPTSDVAHFAAHVLNTSPEAVDVKYNPHTGEWHADYSGWKGKHVKDSQTARKVWGTEKMGFNKLLEAALNNVPVVVRMPDPAGGDKSVVDKDASEAANAKVQEIKDEFKNWVWTDTERAGRLHRHYNDNFNNVVNVKFDGSHQQFPGINPDIKLRDHQKNFVWQVVTTGNGLAGHEVGTGKTYTMAAAAMELRRLGLARKPCLVCKKANVDAVTQDALKLYPGAKILSTADMFDEKNRKRTISQIATGDYDMVIMTHDHLDKMSMRPETQQAFIREQLDQLEQAIFEAWESSGKDKNNRVVKDLEKAKLKLQQKLDESLNAEAKDDAINFEDLGIDQLLVDEAHRYKNLPVYTKMRGLKGISTAPADRAMTMLMRTDWLQKKNNGRGVVFLTGTPISNTMVELYNMQRFIQPNELKERNIHNFDSWAATFGDVQTKMESTATGEYRPVSRFSKFVNLPELMQMTRQMLDVQKADELLNPDGTPVVKRPKKVQAVVTAPKSEGVEKMMGELRARAAALKGRRPGDVDDNMLDICNDGRKGSIDLRMYDEKAVDDPNSKLNLMVNNVLKVSKDNPGKTQMIFSDIGVNPVDTGFHLYGDVIDKLVAGGIPREQIANFSELEGAKREIAMEGLRTGKIRVALGTTERLGTGVNAQNKLIALHHLDCPYRPADLEQRDGRGWRQGNENAEVQIHNYVTEGSLDELLWQGIARKAAFIRQVMTTKDNARVAQEIDTEELTPEQIMAAASGDPRILEKVQLDEDVRALGNAKLRHEREQRNFASTLAEADARKKRHEERIKDFDSMAATLADNPDFHFTVDGRRYVERPDVETPLDDRVRETAGSWRHEKIGNYRGLNVVRTDQGVMLETPGGAHLLTAGTLKSIEAVARQHASRKEQAQNDLAQHEKDVAQIREKHGKPFAKQTELDEKTARRNALEAELSNRNKDEGDGGSAGTPPDYSAVLGALRGGNRKEANRLLLEIGDQHGINETDLKDIANQLLRQVKDEGE